MSGRSAVKKYARGLARVALEEKKFEFYLEQLKSVAELLVSSESVRFALTSPFVSRQQKRKFLDLMVSKVELSPVVRRLLEILVENEKLQLLPEIVESLPEVWAEEKGLGIFEVQSAVELTEEEKGRLKRVLEKKEKKPVRLNFQVNPEIIGGLVLKKGNIFYDISVRGGLLKLKETISQG